MAAEGVADAGGRVEQVSAERVLAASAELQVL